MEIDGLLHYWLASAGKACDYAGWPISGWAAFGFQQSVRTSMQIHILP